MKLTDRRRKSDSGLNFFVMRRWKAFMALRCSAAVSIISAHSLGRHPAAAAAPSPE